MSKKGYKQSEEHKEKNFQRKPKEKYQNPVKGNIFIGKVKK